jgi:two-component system nitrogen regulation response regulator NtrX
MFGHEKGAFSGATETRRGRFELADGGTLFLDEIADLGAEAQAKLLRAIESGQIERIGGERSIPVDVRIIAATNRDLSEEMAAGRFRDDLFYRINVLPLHLPPLRERAGDIPELVQHFFERLRGRDGLATPQLDDGALRRLETYPWPGNVRELANVCERLAILFPGRRVTARDVDGVLPAGAADAADGDRPLHEQLDAFERRLITESLEAADGSIADAARRLRTDRANLYRRMRRLGIER